MRSLGLVAATIVLVVGLLGTAGKLAAQQKAPIPDADAQQAVRKMAAQIYRAEFDAATTDAGKSAVAKKIFDAALKVQSGTVDQYVLLSIAGDMAAGVSDVKTAIKSVEKLSERFDVPTANLKASALATAASHASTTAQHQAVAEAASGVIDELSVADEYETAIQLCELARSAARESRQYPLVRGFTARLPELKEQEAAAKQYRDAMAVLKDHPGDPAANLTAGRYLWFVKGERARGLAMLALGSDPALKEAAIKDLTGAKTAEEQAALGDAWWDLAEKMEGQGIEKDNLMRRAGTWYRQAMTKLEGIGRLRVEKRLDDIAKLGLEMPRGSVPTDWVRIVNPKTGTIIRLYKRPVRIEPAGQYYKLRSQDGRYVGLADWARNGDEGAGTQGLFSYGPDSGSPYNLWQFEPCGNGYWIITNCQSKKCLEAPRKGNETVRQSSFRDGALEQQWRLEVVAPGE